MLGYSPLFTTPTASEWCVPFDDPYYDDILQDFNTQNQYSSFDHYNDLCSSFSNDQFLIPPPSTPMNFPSLPEPPNADQPSPTEEGAQDEKKKKQDHNASERNRRMRINGLYSSLRSLLPAANQMKKLSIPNTIDRALKYIPELQTEVEDLIQRKERLLSTRATTSNSKTIMSSSPMMTRTSTLVETTLLGNGEISIQISSLKSSMVVVPISEVLRVLEEDFGALVVDVSTTESSVGRVFHRIHLMVEEIDEMKCRSLRERVLSLCQRWDNIYSLWMY